MTLLLLTLLACSSVEPQGSPTTEPTVPVDPFASWPKFRGDAAQTGRGRARASDGQGAPWSFPTGKGIFSSAVVDGQGNVFIGSADRQFYALDADGAERWRVETGEIIDSSALLDDEGRVIFGSGDGLLRALDRETGEELWSWQAEDPQVTGAFINWFEGNVAIQPDGTLIVPNDNFRIYAVDRQDGTMKWSLEMPDQTWSLPAVDAATGDLWVANNNVLEARGANTFAFSATGEPRWTRFAAPGSIAASPLLTDHLMVVSAFDGWLHALDRDTGSPAWSVPARDHLYASAGELSSGLIVVPGADGTLYGVDPSDGRVDWRFDTLEPIRSSPAIGADDVIYFGGGDGRLYAVNANGLLRWSMKLIEGDRNDLNSSPALGPHAVVIGGEDGSIWSVPYDWCLFDGAGDERCIVSGEQLPIIGLDLYWTTLWGSLQLEPPVSLAPNQTLAMSVVARDAGNTVLVLLDADSLTVEVEPPQSVTLTLSGDRRFMVLQPAESGWQGDQVRVVLGAQILTEPEREGLAMSGGRPGLTLEEDWTFTVDRTGPLTLPMADPGDRWEVHRLAAPLPTLLPSYNQIGFDSLHYLVSVVRGVGEPGLAWMIGATPDGRPDPASQLRLPLRLSYRDGGLTLANDGGMMLEAMGLRLAFDTFRIDAFVDHRGEVPGGAVISTSAICGEIPFYGSFMRTLGLCNPQTDVLAAFGGVLMRPLPTEAPQDPGAVSFALDGAVASATFSPSFDPTAHLLSLLAIDPSSGEALAADYGTGTMVEPGPPVVVSVTLDEVVAGMELVLIVDSQPAASGIP